MACRVTKGQHRFHAAHVEWRVNGDKTVTMHAECGSCGSDGWKTIHPWDVEDIVWSGEEEDDDVDDE